MTILELTDTELQALVGLVDAGVRATGLRAVKDAANLLEKIESAAAENSNVIELPPKGASDGAEE